MWGRVLIMKVFDPDRLKKLTRRVDTPNNGEVTIIGGSDLFHGAPILSLRVASRIVDMVYFSSPEQSIGSVAEQINKFVSYEIKAQLGSFVWVPWDEVDSYIEKSDSVLIGPGMKRWHKEKERSKYLPAGKAGQKAKIDVFDEAGTQTKFITERLLRKFPDKQWVIDGGALQTMDAKWIPQNAILTPNTKEYEMLFDNLEVSEAARKYNCIIVLKGAVTGVASANECVEVHGGNNGLTKGGTGDVLAGLTVALAAKNEPFLAATAASWFVKKAADSLLERVGTVYNADDLTEEIPLVLGKYV